MMSLPPCEAKAFMLGSVEFFERGDLRLREARIGITFLAQQRGGCEVALPRIVKHAVFYSVGGIAGFVDGVSDRGNFARGNVAGGIERGGMRVPKGAGEQVRPVTRGSAG